MKNLVSFYSFTISKLDFSFSFSRRKFTGTNHFFANIEACEEGEDLDTSAVKTVNWLDLPQPDLAIRLVAKGLEVPYCDAKEPITLYLHKFPQVKDGDAQKNGRERDPSLPLEIIEGS